MEEEKKRLQEEFYKIIEPQLKKRNLYFYMIDKLRKRIDKNIDMYETELLKEKVKYMQLAVQDMFIMKSYNRLVTLDITKYPVWLRCLMWWDKSRWKRWWEELKKRYKESKRKR